MYNPAIVACVFFGGLVVITVFLPRLAMITADEFRAVGKALQNAFRNVWKAITGKK